MRPFCTATAVASGQPGSIVTNFLAVKTVIGASGAEAATADRAEDEIHVERARPMKAALQ
jgi:hypothetical protein